MMRKNRLNETGSFMPLITPYMVKYFKNMFENSPNRDLTHQTYDLLKRLVETFAVVGKSVNMNEMERLA